MCAPRVVSRTNEHSSGKFSLERIVSYVEIEQEPKPTERGKPPASWPTSGEIRVENLTARYSKVRTASLESHGVTLTLEPIERARRAPQLIIPNPCRRTRWSRWENRKRKGASSSHPELVTAVNLVILEFPDVGTAAVHSD